MIYFIRRYRFWFCYLDIYALLKGKTSKRFGVFKHIYKDIAMLQILRENKHINQNINRLCKCVQGIDVYSNFEYFKK